MKKIYALAFAAIFGSAVASAEVATVAIEKSNLKPSKELLAGLEGTGSKVVAKEIAKAPAAVSDMCGTYLWRGKNYLAGQSGKGRTDTIVVSPRENDPTKVKVEFKGWFYSTATTNEENGTITLERINFEADENGIYDVFCAIDWSGDSPLMTSDPIEFTYAGGALTLPQGTILSMCATTDPTGSKIDKGYYFLKGNNSIIKENAEWETLGTTEFTDEFAGPLFGYTGDKAKTGTVTVNKLKGVDIYKMDGMIVMSPKTSLIIDATDPDNVIVPGQKTEIIPTGRGTTYFASASFTAVDPTAVAAKIKLADGVFTIDGKSSRWNWPEWTVKNADGSTTDNRGNWYYGNELTSTLTLPNGNSSVSEIVENNAPVEYFNLQGVKVSEPAKGQLVIRRQGAKTTKVVIR